MIQIFKIDDLVPYENNPRFNEKAVDAVAKSINEFGFKVPIVIDRNNVIVAGHTRWKASQKLGLTEVPCIVADDLTDEQVKAYRLADNKIGELADWDFIALEQELAGIEMDMERFGFNLEEIETELTKQMDDDREVVEDEVPDVDEESEPIVKLGEVWQLGRHRLMCGDSTDMNTVESLMGGKKGDMVMTDPPYNVNYQGGTNEKLKIENDNMNDEDFYKLLLKAFQCCHKNIKNGAPVYVWYTEKETENFIRAFKKYFLHHETLIWNKNSIVLGHLDYHKKHEPCLYGWKSGKHYFTDDRTQSSVYEDKGIQPKKMKKEELIKLVEQMLADKRSTTVIDEDKPVVNGEHPTMKPIKLLARLIKNSSRPTEIVLDVFGGSGSTLIACEQLDRTCYMMELDPKYCDVIIKRWENLTGNKAVKL